jgi:hypothetical protein
MSYLFNNIGRIGTDVTDQSQQNVYNTRFANYTLSNYFSESTSDQHVQFAVEQPTMTFSGTSLGGGLNGSIVDADSQLLHGSQQERSLEKLQLLARPFATVPYLGRGSCDPTLESQLLQGEAVSELKSVSTIMDKSFSSFMMQPVDSNRAEMIESLAIDGWTRGGSATRVMATDPYLAKNSRPNVQF